MTFTAPCFRIVAGEFGFSRVPGLPALRVTGLFPYAACPADMPMPSPRTVLGIFGSARIRGYFVCFGESGSNRSRGPGWGFRAWLLALVADPSKGGLWLGFSQGGVAYFKDGQVSALYAAADGSGCGPC